MFIFAQIVGFNKTYKMTSITQRKVTYLLRNISKGLEALSLDELSLAVTKILSKTKSNSDEIILLSGIACEEFNVSAKAIYEKYSRGNSYKCKVSMIIIMFNTMGMTKSEISRNFRLFPNSITAVFKYYNNLNPEKFKDDADFLNRHKRVLEKFLIKINAKNNGKV